MLNLEPLFNPKTIAVLGASAEPAKVGGRALRYLAVYGYQGQVCPVNPKYEHLGDLRCYPSLSAIPEEVDLALIGLPAKQVLPALQQCIDKGVKAAIVYSGGFAETGDAGREAQTEIRELAEGSGLVIVGPNCLGILNVPKGINVTFTSACERKSDILPGRVGFITQSGALGAFTFSLAKSLGVGFSTWISTGNEAFLQFADCARYMLEDPATDLIAGYLEAIRDGRRFVEMAHEALAKRKPIIVLKAGRSQVGARAASSHTGAMAGEDRIYDAVLRQYGIVRAGNIEELFDFAAAFTPGKLPNGNRVGIVTMSGGAGVLMADRCAELGLEVGNLAPETVQRLGAILPSFIAAANPVDFGPGVITEPGLLKKCLLTILRDPGLDLVFLAMGASTHIGDQLAADIVAANQEADKPILVSWMGGQGEPVERIRQGGLFIQEDPIRSVGAGAALWQYQQALRRSAAPQVLAKPATTSSSSWPDGSGPLAEYETKAVLAQWGVPVVREGLAHTADEAARVAAEIGYPVVLKVQSPQIAHKTEAGAVKLDIRSEVELRQSYDEILDNSRRYQPGAQIAGVSVQELIAGGVEAVVGVVRDAQLGPIVMFGLGGIFTEILKDVSFRRAPLTRVDAEEMVNEIKGLPLLQGSRGRPPSDLEAVIDVLMKVSSLAIEMPESITDIDINPLIVLPEGKGAVAADALIVRR